MSIKKIKIDNRGRVESIDREEDTLNWIDSYHKSKNKLPPLPNYLSPVVNNCVAGNPLSKDIEVITPSGQYWHSLTTDQKVKLLELVEYLEGEADDYIKEMESMFPQDPPGKRRF